MFPDIRRQTFFLRAYKAVGIPALGLVLLGVSMAACGSGNRTAFRVETDSFGEVSPTQEPSSSIVITFNAEVDPTTVHDATVLLRSEAGDLVPLSVSRSFEQALESSRQIVARPRSALASGGVHRLTVTQGLRALDGRSLSEPFVRDFTTSDRRAFGPPIRVAGSGRSQVQHVTVDGVGEVHVLTTEATASSGQTQLHTVAADGTLSLQPEQLPAPAFALDLVGVGGSPSGALVIDTPGGIMTRSDPGVWSDPVDIEVQPRPIDLPATSPWPDPFLYRFRSGGCVSSGLRLGPLVPSSPNMMAPECRLVTASESVSARFSASEEIWDAVVGLPLLTRNLGDAFVLGSGVAQDGSAGREVFVFQPGFPFRSSIGVDAGERLDSRMAIEPHGLSVAAWLLRVPNEGAGAEASDGELELGVSRFVGFRSRLDNTFVGVGVGGDALEVTMAPDMPLPGWIPAFTLRTPILSDQPDPEVAVAVSGARDAIVAWAVREVGANKTLRVAHFVESDGDPGSENEGWRRLEDLSDQLPSARGSFDVAIDGNGHAVLAWSQLSSGLRELFSRRYDAQADVWEEPELVFSSATEDVADVRVVADAEGRFTMVWTEDRNVMFRRLQ